MIAVLLLVGLVSIRGRAQEAAPKPAPQNPSPMVEHTRAHQRLEERTLPGSRLVVQGILAQPVKIFIPGGATRSGRFRLLIHFHGAGFVPEYAAAEARTKYILAAVALGPGSAVYERAFTDPAVFDDLLGSIHRQLASRLDQVNISAVVLSGFSAGYGAIRAILREPRHAAAIDAVLLLDGLHTSYVPPGSVLAQGGTLDEAPLAPFVRFAEAAVAGRKAMLVTHSEIFPGTFASTTETSDFLIRTLGLKRVAVLEWGPLGMQQLSVVNQGRLRILGFAGNSGPDHTDHFHAMHHFLHLLEAIGVDASEGERR